MAIVDTQGYFSYSSAQSLHINCVLRKAHVMHTRPVIGLNMSVELTEKYERVGLLVPVSYVDAVAGAGGIPLCLPPFLELAMLREAIPLLDGIVLIGGDDYRPEHYGGHAQPENELMHTRRDRFDMELAKVVLQEYRLPVLGICGGHQLLSIALGGALIQDIRTEWGFSADYPPLPHAKRERDENRDRDFRHPVRLEEDSLIERVVQLPPDTMLMANSSHHQSVHPGRVGKYLRASAWTPDGVVEAIEPALDSPWARSGRFVLGVQWHPEQLQTEELHQNIFRALVKAAQKK